MNRPFLHLNRALRRLAAVAHRARCRRMAFAQMAKLPATPPGAAVATFAGGCFWCMEQPVRQARRRARDDVRVHRRHEERIRRTSRCRRAAPATPKPCRCSTTRRRFPTRSCSTCSGTTSTRRSTDRQFCDVGTQYRTGIFVYDDAQRAAAEASKAALEKSKPFKEAIVTPIVTATEFWPAEEYHQDYYVKNPIRYSYYRTGCGRDARLKQLWGSAAPHRPGGDPLHGNETAHRRQPARGRLRRREAHARRRAHVGNVRVRRRVGRHASPSSCRQSSPWSFFRDNIDEEYPAKRIR